VRGRVTGAGWDDFEILTDLINSFGEFGKVYSSFVPVLAISIAAAYGGIHLCAIHSLFPSEIELTILRSSCYILLGSSVLIVVILLGIRGIEASASVWRLVDDRLSPKTALDRRRRLSRLWADWVTVLMKYSPFRLVRFIGCFLGKAIYTIFFVIFLSIFYAIVYGIPIGGILLYIAARLFIVVESFISLRHVPVGVYQTPDINFMGYIPHL